jgi:hypothetical protein
MRAELSCTWASFQHAAMSAAAQTEPSLETTSDLTCAEVLWNLIASAASIFGRLVTLASLRSADGIYRHDLSQGYGPIEETTHYGCCTSKSFCRGSPSASVNRPAISVTTWQDAKGARNGS